MLKHLVLKFLNDFLISLFSRVDSIVGSVIKKLMAKPQLPVQTTSAIRFTKKLL